jgi:hypothetical protein
MRWSVMSFSFHSRCGRMRAAALSIIPSLRQPYWGRELDYVQSVAYRYQVRWSTMPTTSPTTNQWILNTVRTEKSAAEPETIVFILKRTWLHLFCGTCGLEVTRKTLQVHDFFKMESSVGGSRSKARDSWTEQILLASCGLRPPCPFGWSSPFIGSIPTIFQWFK